MVSEISKSALVATVAFAALALTASSSFANDSVAQDSGFRPYISLFAGGSLPDRQHGRAVNYNDQYGFELSPGYIIGADIGLHITDQLRAELELSRANFQSNGKWHGTNDGQNGVNGAGGLHATYLLANAWLDIPTNSSFTPYIGGGAGVGWIGGDLSAFGPLSVGIGAEKSAGFAFQLGVGVKTELTSNLSLDLGYRFKDIIGAKASNKIVVATDWDQLNLTSHNIQLGLTYNF
jgi:opacity protein-like surface antigen